MKASALLLGRNLRALLSCLGQTNGNGLLAALDLPRFAAPLCSLLGFAVSGARRCARCSTIPGDEAPGSTSTFIVFFRIIRIQRPHLHHARAYGSNQKNDRRVTICPPMQDQ
jgi:hypothetical protein